MAVIGELATLITARTKPFTDGLKVATTHANKFSSGISNKLGGALRGLTGMLSGTTGAIIGLGGALTAGGVVMKSLQLASSAEDMQMAYATYLKSMTKAKDVLAQIQKYAGATNFQAPEIKEAGKQLLAFGFDVKDLMTVIRVLGDLSAGSQKPMADFVDILGKVKASGVASMGDINRLADRGVPIFTELAKVMGVATSEVRTLVGAGKVGFGEVWQSLNNVVGVGGLFENAVAKMATTTSGKFSSLVDEITEAMTGIGTGILTGLDLKGLTVQLTELVSMYRDDIVGATVWAVESLAGAMKDIANTVLQLKKFGDYISYQYHNAASMYWGGVDMLGKLPGADAGDARRYALEHQSAMYESQISGIATTQRQYGMGTGKGTQAMQAQQQQAVQQQGQMTMPQVWAMQEQQAREQQRAYMLQLREQQRTNELLRQQNQMQQQPQVQVVESF